MTLEVWTGRYGLVDPARVDITRSGADRAIQAGEPLPAGWILAPSADLLWGAKRALGTLEALRLAARVEGAEYWARADRIGEEYAVKYKAEMRASYRTRRAEWEALLARDRAVLVCFCADAARCHRSIAAAILGCCGATVRGEIPTLRAISVRQPWAWAILHAAKDIENRGPTWARTEPGEAILHAAKGCTVAEYDAAAGFIEEVACGLEVPPLASLPRGGLVGRMQIGEVVRSSDSPWFVGPLGLTLTDARPCAFAPCSGALGFFPVSLPWLNLLRGAP